MSAGKMLFLNVGWMKFYQGLYGDEISGGGAYVREHGYGLEIFNFQPHNGRLYGYVQVNGAFNLGRLGASSEDQSINGILVVWVARHPQGGTYIVGWYQNATVYNELQPAPPGSARVYNGRAFGYYVEANEGNCRLLPLDARVFPIPRGRGGMGQANVWYADKATHQKFKQSVWDFVTNGVLPRDQNAKPKQRRGRRPNPFRRQKVEEKAVTMTRGHYEGMDYVVDSVESDNLGWDLEATRNGRSLLLECKGLSGRNLSIELTPNEYEKMRHHRDRYRICVVTEALTAHAKLRVFLYSRAIKAWEDEKEKGARLEITERTGARLSLKRSDG